MPVLLVGWMAFGVVASSAVLAAAWRRNRELWRAEQARSRRWLLAHAVDPGPPPPDPAAWRLVLTPDLSPAGALTWNIGQNVGQDVRPVRERARTRRPAPGRASRSWRTGG